MTLSRDEADRRVRAGAAVLDEHYTNGDWRQKLRDKIADGARIDVVSSYTCPLGLLYGAYSTGRDLLRAGGAHFTGTACAFATDYQVDGPEQNAAWHRYLEGPGEPTFTLSELRALYAAVATGTSVHTSLSSLLDSRDPALQKVSLELTRVQAKALADTVSTLPDGVRAAAVHALAVEA